MERKYHHFGLYFMIGIAFGVLVNVLSYWLRSDGSIVADDSFMYVGWPFTMWLYEPGYVFREWFSWGNTALNIAAWTFAAALFALVLSRIRYTRSRLGLNLCHQCHYDLRGSSGSESCPECGTAIDRGK